MTVVIWDHRVKALGADKQATQADLVRKVTKIKRIHRHLCAAAGDWDLAQEMFHWFEQGADPEKAPACMRSKEDWVAFLVITPEGRVLKYEKSPYPMDFTESAQEDGWYVFGSGRDYAIGALAKGATLLEALEITAKYCSGCGQGYDIFTLT